MGEPPLIGKVRHLPEERRMRRIVLPLMLLPAGLPAAAQDPFDRGYSVRGLGVTALAGGCAPAS